VRSVLIADKRLFSAETIAPYGHHGSSLASRVEHVGWMVVAEVVSEQDVDRRLVKAVTVSVLVWAEEAATELRCWRDAVTLQRAQEPPLDHVLVDLALYIHIA